MSNKKHEDPSQSDSSETSPNSDGKSSAADSSNQITLLEKLTVTYSSREDRLCMSAATHGGDTYVFWLTQRFGRVLLPRLIEWVENQGEGLLQPNLNERSSQRASLGPINAKQAAKQQAQAQMQQRPSQPVQPAKDSLEQLLHSVDLKQLKQHLLLIIPLKESGNKVGVQFSQTALSQWLGIVYRAYVEAQWPLEIWPEWFSLAQEKPSELLDAKLH
jgi:hypothetical protein